METQPQLFFIALIPPPEVCEAVTVYKRDLMERFGSKAALKVVPHITLKAPFKLPPEDTTALRQWFQQLNVPQSPFPVRLNGFGAFPKSHSPVLFIRPELSPELADLQRSMLEQFGAQYPHLPVGETERHFHPHMTVAYRDLKPEMFQMAWKEYEHKAFEAAFFADSVHLLHHDGKRWQVIETRVMAKG